MRERHRVASFYTCYNTITYYNKAKLKLLFCHSVLTPDQKCVPQSAGDRLGMLTCLQRRPWSVWYDDRVATTLVTSNKEGSAEILTRLREPCRHHMGETLFKTFWQRCEPGGVGRLHRLHPGNDGRTGYFDGPTDFHSVGVRFLGHGTCQGKT